MISIIVPTYNRAALLEEALASFYAQPDLASIPHELIVVDNNSKDPTREVARHFENRPGFRYVFEAIQGLDAARNRGLAEARGEILAFLDDDVVLSGGWLAALERCFAETGADAVGGRAYLIFDAPPPPWLGKDLRVCLSEVELGATRKDAGDGRRLFGLNLAVRREALARCGGFDDALDRKGGALLCGGERAMLRAIYRHGGRCIYEPAMALGHRAGADRLNWDYFLRLAEGMGQTKAILEKDRPRTAWATALIKLALYAAANAPLTLLARNSTWHKAVLFRLRRVQATLRALAHLPRQ